MESLGLRSRLVAGFVGIAALTTLVSALLTSYAVHSSFDAYLEQRTRDAARSAVTLAESAHADAGGWSARSLDLLSHELVLTGYDFRLIADGRTLLDTTKLDAGRDFRRVTRAPVRGAGGEQVAYLELYALGPRGDMPADDQLRGELDRGHLIAAALAALVAIGAGLVVAGRMSDPLRRLAVIARAIADRDGTPPAEVGGSREVRELGEALGELADDLERQRRARRQLAQDLSHELRTPLMLLQSRIEAMQDGIVPFDATGLATLHTETLRLSRLIGQIELLAEAEAQPPPLRSDELALGSLAGELHDALAAAFEVHELELDLQATPVVAHADRDAVRQIATNLLSNALKYAPDGDRVCLSTTRENGMAVLRVRNVSGRIPPAERSRIFERFYRGSAAFGATSGAGLGLAIARELAEAQDGTLELEEVPAGTSFALRLPTSPRRRDPAAAGGSWRRQLRTPRA